MGLAGGTEGSGGPQLQILTCRLRPLSPGDLRPFHRLLVEPHVHHYLLGGEAKSLEWAADAVERSCESFRSSGLGLWLLFSADHSELMGFAGFLFHEAPSAAPQMVFALRQDCARTELATELVLTLVQHAEEVGNPGTIRAAVCAEQPVSEAVLQRAGFHRSGWGPGGQGETLLMERHQSACVLEQRRGWTSWGARSWGLEHSWEGHAAPGCATLRLDFRETELLVDVQAPFHGDPPPPHAVGSCPRLWEYEVLELFLLGSDERYLELELGPYGHHLVLQLEGRRNIVQQGMDVLVRARRDAGRWWAQARIPFAWLPADLSHFNFAAMHGGPTERFYGALFTQPGEPDFHCLAAYGSLDGG